MSTWMFIYEAKGGGAEALRRIGLAEQYHVSRGATGAGVWRSEHRSRMHAGAYSHRLDIFKTASSLGRHGSHFACQQAEFTSSTYSAVSVLSPVLDLSRRALLAGIRLYSALSISIATGSVPPVQPHTLEQPHAFPQQTTAHPTSRRTLQLLVSCFQAAFSPGRL